MSIARKFVNGLVFGSALGLLCGASARAEDTAAPTSTALPASSSLVVEAADPAQTAPVAKLPSQTAGGGSFASSDSELSDSKWHFYGTGYLWFPGIHGTLGVRGFQTGVHVSAIDLLSNFRFGIMGAVIPTYNRFSVPIDYFWVRLKDDKTIPVDPNYSVQAKVTESIVTPKVSYLMVNNPKVKIYGTAGPRFWHESTTLSLDPSFQGLNPTKSVSWVDFVAGARFNLPLSSKASVDILGDAGEGGATLDYQVAGFVNYQIKPKITMQGGWRYLTVHYGNQGNLFNGTMQGIILGATYKFK